jgi:hypothetical protein
MREVWREYQNKQIRLDVLDDGIDGSEADMKKMKEQGKKGLMPRGDPSSVNQQNQEITTEDRTYLLPCHFSRE